MVYKHVYSNPHTIRAKHINGLSEHSWLEMYTSEQTTYVDRTTACSSRAFTKEWQIGAVQKQHYWGGYITDSRHALFTL